MFVGDNAESVGLGDQMCFQKLFEDVRHCGFLPGESSQEWGLPH